MDQQHQVQLIVFFLTTHFKQLNTMNCFWYKSLSQLISFIIVKLKKSSISCSKYFSCVKWCVGLGGSDVMGRHAGYLIHCSFWQGWGHCSTLSHPWWCYTGCSVHLTHYMRWEQLCPTVCLTDHWYNQSGNYKLLLTDKWLLLWFS